MIARIETVLPGPVESLWRQIIKPASLMYVASPILRFVPEGKTRLGKTWEQGEVYTLRLRALGVLPLGVHRIHMLSVDNESHSIVTRESSRLIKTWNHAINIHESGSGCLTYVDEVEIRAGLLTLPVWLFAQVFYRHRQRRWKRVLERGLEF